MNVTLNNPYAYGGGITGCMSSSPIVDSGVQGMTVKVDGATSDLRLGGIVGYLNYSSAGNC